MKPEMMECPHCKRAIEVVRIAGIKTFKTHDIHPNLRQVCPKSNTPAGWG